MELRQFVDEGLGHSAGLVISARAGVAAPIGPLRDVDRYQDAARAAGATSTHVIETHVHNDFITGSRELAARAGARVRASVGAGLQLGRQVLRDGDVVIGGDMSISVMATPGRTSEHASYLAAGIVQPKQPPVRFSGGSLLVGNDSRTEHLSHEHAAGLARELCRSLHQKTVRLSDDVAVYPAHGAGSFRTATPGVARTTTAGAERRHNATQARYGRRLRRGGDPEQAELPDLLPRHARGQPGWVAFARPAPPVRAPNRMRGPGAPEPWGGRGESAASRPPRRRPSTWRLASGPRAAAMCRRDQLRGSNRPQRGGPVGLSRRGGRGPGRRHDARFGLAACFTAPLATAAAQAGLGLDGFRTRAEFDLHSGKVLGLAGAPAVAAVPARLAVDSPTPRPEFGAAVRETELCWPASYYLTSSIRPTSTLVERDDHTNAKQSSLKQEVLP